MNNDQTFECKLFRSTLKLSVSQNKDHTSIAASVWNRVHIVQQVFTMSEKTRCYIDPISRDDEASLWIGSTCFVIKRSDGEKLAKLFDIRVVEGRAA